MDDFSGWSVHAMDDYCKCVQYSLKRDLLQVVARLSPKTTQARKPAKKKAAIARGLFIDDDPA
jgi:hypothetical protein